MFTHEPLSTRNFPTKEKSSGNLAKGHIRGQAASPMQAKSCKSIPPSIQLKQNQSQSINYPLQTRDNKSLLSSNGAIPIQKKGFTFNEEILPLINEENVKEITPPIPMCVNTDSARLNLRKGAEEKSKVIGSLKQGEEVKADKVEKGWYHVIDESKQSGYVKAEYVLEQQAMPTTRMRVDITSGTLTLRYNPSKTGAEKDKLLKDEQIDAFKSLTGWYKVNTVRPGINKDGYVSADFVKPDINISNFKHHPFEPKDWNDGEEKISTYNKNKSKNLDILRTSQQLTNNCYSYAFNYKKAPVDFKHVPVKKGEFFGTPINKAVKGFGMQPGYLSGAGSMTKPTDHNKIVEEGDRIMINLVKADAEANGLTFTELNSSSEGGYVVAVVVRPSSYDYRDADFHWYRQNEDGTWSHKPGASEVTDKAPALSSKIGEDKKHYAVYSNESITDPIQAGRANGYTSFLGYFMIKQKGV